ncbi:hypothetical protein C8T65DRAFT_746629 [Cerioporus squamosus]|nr:hypothetical protein C8T65DRAFT_746629 [Cerioporus squamosus]
MPICLEGLRHSSSKVPVATQCGDSSDDTADLPLDPEVWSCLERLATVAEYYARGTLINCHALLEMLKALQTCLAALEGGLHSARWEDAIGFFQEQRDLLMASSLKFREDRVLLSQFNRWSALLHSDKTTLSSMERRVSRGYRQRAELQGEQETTLMVLEELGARKEAEAVQHGAMIEELGRRLQALQRDVEHQS